MTISETLGKYGERSDECEYLTLAFSPSHVPLRSRWRNNGLSADFLGDYVITFLPAKGGMAAVESHQNEIKYAVTYIANELLENAMKYHERDVDVPVRIHLELTSDHIIVSVSNSIGAGQAELYKSFVERLLEGDPGEMLLKQQEESAKSEESAASGVGLLTMINDYDAQLGWRFEVHPVQSQVMTVTTSAVLPLKSIPGGAA
jgi:hypothetical protein